MPSKVWLSLCLLLFAHNLIELIRDRYLLSYKIVEEGDRLFEQDSDLNYLFCAAFWGIQKRDLSRASAHERIGEKLSEPFDCKHRAPTKRVQSIPTKRELHF